jgi:preprotein translocase subunit SecB
MKNRSTRDVRGFIEHPIRLVDLGVRELFIEAHVQPDVSIVAELASCSITVSHMPYDTEQKRIVVSLKLDLGSEEGKPKAPYSMRIELIGIFEVDEDKFPVEQIEDWAIKGAPLVLYPYLREHAFGLSSRCGFSPLLLPLVVVPTFKIEKTVKPTRRKSK